MKKVMFFVAVGIASLICGCTRYVPVSAPTPCCNNPYHDHYIAPPMLLWEERITTETYQKKVEERFWKPNR